LPYEDAGSELMSLWKHQKDNLPGPPPYADLAAYHADFRRSAADSGMSRR
jgi:hypothetical protein